MVGIVERSLFTHNDHRVRSTVYPSDARGLLAHLFIQIITYDEYQRDGLFGIPAFHLKHDFPGRSLELAVDAGHKLRVPFSDQPFQGLFEGVADHGHGYRSGRKSHERDGLIPRPDDAGNIRFAGEVFVVFFSSHVRCRICLGEHINLQGLLGSVPRRSIG